MGAIDIEAVLADPDRSPWLDSALRTALARDPVDAAADAALLLAVLDRRLAESLRAEIDADAVPTIPRADSAAA